jgi:hypothetical protein
VVSTDVTSVGINAAMSITGVVRWIRVFTYCSMRRFFCGYAMTRSPPAILDRLMHRWIPVEIRGRSYRLKDASSRLATAEESA